MSNGLGSKDGPAAEKLPGQASTAAAEGEADPVLKLKRGMRKFFEQQGESREASYSLSRAEALDLVKAVHEDRKRSVNGEKQKEMLERSLKKARQEIQSLEAEVANKDKTIMALQDENRTLWQEKTFQSRKICNVKNMVRETHESVMGINNIVQSFAASVAATDPNEEDTQTD